MDVGAGAAAHLVAHPRCSGAVGATGFCLGGAMAFAAACNVPAFTAVVPFYGLPVRAKADFTKARAPIQAHFATDDPFVAPERARALCDGLRARDYPIEVHFYAAKHAFMNDTHRGHDPAAAALAWERAVAFLHRHLG
jgi:carboxymethylenebutenolidase